MTTFSQQAETLDLVWNEGDPVSLSGILRGKAGWAGAAVAESDTPTIAGATVTVTADNDDAVVTFVLADSSAMSRGEYAWNLRSVGGPILATGRVVVLFGPQTAPAVQVVNTTIEAGDVFDWLNVQNPKEDALTQMTKVVRAVSARISRTHDIPATLPDDDWTLAHIMQSGRIWKRKVSPEGVIASDEFGTIRVTRIDADIEEMLINFRKGPWG